MKPLYGQQEQAVRGYNPTKQGRPSHVYQTYFIAAIRMVLDVEVQAGNQTASQYAQPGLWAWLDRRPRAQWPKLVRGDIAWGTERMMVECEKRSLPYLFKIRQTTKVKRHIAQWFGRDRWAPAGGGWQGLSSELQLSGWSRKRRVVMLRRRVRESLADHGGERGQGTRRTVRNGGGARGRRAVRIRGAGNAAGGRSAWDRTTLPGSGRSGERVRRA